MIVLAHDSVKAPNIKITSSRLASAVRDFDGSSEHSVSTRARWRAADTVKTRVRSAKRVDVSNRYTLVLREAEAMLVIAATAASVMDGIEKFQVAVTRVHGTVS